MATLKLMRYGIVLRSGNRLAVVPYLEKNRNDYYDIIHDDFDMNPDDFTYDSDIYKKIMAELDLYYKQCEMRQALEGAFDSFYITNYDLPSVKFDGYTLKQYVRQGKLHVELERGDRTIIIDDEILEHTMISYHSDRVFYRENCNKKDCNKLYVRYYDSGKTVLLESNVYDYEVIDNSVYAVIYTKSSTLTAYKVVKINYNEEGVLDKTTVYKIKKGEEHIMEIRNLKNSNMFAIYVLTTDCRHRIYFFDNHGQIIKQLDGLEDPIIQQLDGLEDPDYTFMLEDYVFVKRDTNIFLFPMKHFMQIDDLRNIDLDKYSQYIINKNRKYIRNIEEVRYFSYKNKDYLFLQVVSDEKYIFMVYDIEADRYYFVDALVNDSDIHASLYAAPEQSEYKALGVQYVHNGIRNIVFYDLNDMENIKVIKKHSYPTHNTQYHPDKYIAVEIDCDGVPCVIMKKKNIQVPAGILVVVYGAYGHNTYNPNDISFLEYYLLEQGFYLFFIEPRGGGYYGYEWHKAGMGVNKINTIQDSYKVFEYIVREYIDKYDVKAVVMGGSAGAIPVFWLADKYSDKISGVVIRSGYLDMMYDFLQNRKIPTSRKIEYGDPEKLSDYQVIKSISPYQNIKRKKYPPFFFIAGHEDRRVLFTHSVRFYLKMKEYSGEQVLLYIGEHDHELAGDKQDVKYYETLTLCFILKNSQTG